MLAAGIGLVLGLFHAENRNDSVRRPGANASVFVASRRNPARARRLRELEAYVFPVAQGSCREGRRVGRVGRVSS